MSGMQASLPLAVLEDDATENFGKMSILANRATDVGLLGSWQVAFVLDESCKGQEVQAKFRLEACTKSGMESGWTKRMTTGKRSGPRRRLTFMYANKGCDGPKAP